MVNKIVVSLVVLLMALGVAIYFRVEFKYQMVSNGQRTILTPQLKKALKMQATNTHSLEDFVGQVVQKNGVTFASDFEIYDSYLHKACEPHCLSRLSYYKNTKLLVDAIVIKDMWIETENKTKDRVADYILERELRIIAKGLLRNRAQMADNYSKIDSNDLKIQANETIKLIDIKMAEIKQK